MKAFVEQDTCIGCGLCCGMCDTVFCMNEAGKAEACREASEEKRDDCLFSDRIQYRSRPQQTANKGFSGCIRHRTRFDFSNCSAAPYGWY
ncbi:ferredoxin [Oscillospiraceae bacterium NSJ-64]|uniref:Ferredoxin n=1 Tax=Youxingia wuxianensis TaxID=2763678 RepID=A0A926IIS9_9FIRM|nr:ferredoxin [Youxingia wuxianensis]MBC8585988.1 ferredoxin [Youxingia wuxianensis]